jgi:hypothetical protein
VQKSEPAPAAPGAADLPPTEALFDAINRGDMLSARDAVNRGADINGRNVLGMTPLDLSIDLGRNEITFLLLSLRQATPRDTAPSGSASATNAGKSTVASRAEARRAGKALPAVAEAANPPSPAKPARAERPARVAAQTPKPKTPAPAQTAATPPQAAQPRQYAGQREETGTPIPQMGFLGFGVTR